MHTYICMRIYIYVHDKHDTHYVGMTLKWSHENCMCEIGHERSAKYDTHTLSNMIYLVNYDVSDTNTLYLIRIYIAFEEHHAECISASRLWCIRYKHDISYDTHTLSNMIYLVNYDICYTNMMYQICLYLCLCSIFIDHYDMSDTNMIDQIQTCCTLFEYEFTSRSKSITLNVLNVYHVSLQFK